MHKIYLYTEMEEIMKNSNEYDIRKAIATSDMFQLLSILLYLPTPEIVKGLSDGSLSQDILIVLSELGFSVEIVEEFEKGFLLMQNSDQTGEKLLTEMRREYTRLFFHPREPEIAIYETMFRYDSKTGESQPSLYISPAALDAERCYKKAGLAMSKEINEPSDHMAIELEFMTYLYTQKAIALKNNLEEEISRRDAEIIEFKEAHLKKWAIAFFNKLATVNHSNYYKIIGEIGSIFMTDILETKTI